ncbi:MAG: BMP family ABC transporter substrate-binding protein, partial [Oscillospiraceae bacterium]|nr:BMP family ABC transporter substrate-binding protein [Oscillospiraceae bacterium]
MKKILALVLVLVMVFALAACGAPADTPSTPDAPSTTSTPSTPSTPDFKVGAIYINSKNDTAGYTFAHHNGITTAMKELGLDPETQLVIQDEVPEDYEQVGTAVDTLVGE